MRRKFYTLLIASALTLLIGCAATPDAGLSDGNKRRDSSDLLIVDCLLPGQVRQLGTRLTYQSPRRPIKTTASVCSIRGGEYVSFDRANSATAFKIWLPKAKDGDAEAQTYVGEIYEKGLGVPSDFQAAAFWYRKAADQNYSRAQINLGYLLEAGLGVTQDLPAAMNYYRLASGITDGDLEYVSSVEFANREAAKAETAALRVQVGELQSQLEAQESRYREQRSQLDVNESELDELRAQITEQRSVVIAEAQSEATVENLKKIETLETQLASAAAEEDRLNQQLIAQQNETAELRKQYAATNKELFERQKRLTETENRIARLEADSTSSSELAKAKAEVTALQNEINQLKDNQSVKSTQLAQSVDSAEQNEQRLKSLIDRQADSIVSLETQQEQARVAYEAEIARLQAQINNNREEQIRLTSELSQAEVDARIASSQNQDLREALLSKNDLIATREEEQKRLTNKLAELQVSDRVNQTEIAELQSVLGDTTADLEIAKLEQKRLTNKLLDEQLEARKIKRDSASQLAALEEQLAEREELIKIQKARVESLEQDVSETRARANTTQSEQITQVVANGPSIDIIDPPLLVTRGAPTIQVAGANQVELIGKIDPHDNLLKFSINGQPQSVNDSGVFTFTGARNSGTLNMVAVDNTGVSTRLALNVGEPSAPAAEAPTPAPAEAPVKGINFGKYYALIIGNNDYETMSDLNTAENDARAIDRILREKYGFKTELLINSTKLDLLSSLNRLRETMTPNDNLLVYYAGHGEIDPATRRGYWLPVDANPSDNSNWISNVAVTDFLNTIDAKHILVVADSCYSGTMTRSSVARPPANMSAKLRTKWLKAISQAKVRAVLSSGGVKPVFDGANNAKHSLFADVFIDELQGNRGVMEGYSLFFKLQGKVTQSAQQLGVDQSPQYAPIKHAGHEAGEFLFIPSRLRTAAAPIGVDLERLASR